MKSQKLYASVNGGYIWIGWLVVLGLTDIYGSRCTHLPCTHCILVSSSTVICWASPFVILGMLSLIYRFYSIFDGKSVSNLCLPGSDATYWGV